jgi:hypothetical protein
MADSDQKRGLAERLKGSLQARKDRAAEKARIKGDLQRDRATLDKRAAPRKGGSSGGV